MRNLLFLFCLCLLASCHKDGTRKTEKMLRGDWRMTEMYIDDSTDSSYNGNYIQPGCQDDDFTRFGKNGAYTVFRGEQKCDKHEAPTENGTWALSDERTLVLSEATYQVNELTNNVLRMTSTHGNGTVMLTASFVYRKIK